MQGINIQTSTPRSCTNYSIQSDAQSSVSNSSIGPQALISNYSRLSNESDLQERQNPTELITISPIQDIQHAQKTLKEFRRKYNPNTYAQKESEKNNPDSRCLQIMYNFAVLKSIQSINITQSAPATKRQKSRIQKLLEKKTKIAAELLARLKSLNKNP